jgi:hypothetical protein
VPRHMITRSLSLISIDAVSSFYEQLLLRLQLSSDTHVSYTTSALLISECFVVAQSNVVIYKLCLSLNR